MIVSNEHLQACKEMRRRRTLPRVAALILGLSLVVPLIGIGVSGAIGAGTISNYSSRHISYPLAITAGPDGAVWFTNSLPPNGKGFGAGHNSIGRITMAGDLSVYTSLDIAEPSGITAGPDGALWFTNTGNGSIGRITTTGVVTSYNDPTIWSPMGITAGRDGALWFANFGDNSIGRITTAGAVTDDINPTISGPVGITAGPDGALWFTNSGNNSIGRITTAGVVTDYTDASISQPSGITAGPDGALWFTNTGNGSIGRITTAGVVTDYTNPTISGPVGITAGPDGALWFTNSGNNSIGRITTTGVVTELHGCEHFPTQRHHGGTGRGIVVYSNRQRLDRADHHDRAACHHYVLASTCHCGHRLLPVAFGQGREPALHLESGERVRKAPQGAQAGRIIRDYFGHTNDEK